MWYNSPCCGGEVGACACTNKAPCVSRTWRRKRLHCETKTKDKRGRPGARSRSPEYAPSPQVFRGRWLEPGVTVIKSGLVTALQPQPKWACLELQSEFESAACACIWNMEARGWLGTNKEQGARRPGAFGLQPWQLAARRQTAA